MTHCIECDSVSDFLAKNSRDPDRLLKDCVVCGRTFITNWEPGDNNVCYGCEFEDAEQLR